MLPKAELFKEFRDGVVFVETGAGDGNGLWAADEAGYQTMYSFEKAKFLSEKVQKEVIKNPLFFGCALIFNIDSREGMRRILPKIKTKCTFWLDSHYSKGQTVGEGDNPVIEELRIIGAHHIKNHNILIDDLRYFGTDYFDGITINDLKEELLKINKDYLVEFRDGENHPSDVMVAYLER